METNKFENLLKRAFDAGVMSELMDGAPNTFNEWYKQEFPSDPSINNDKLVMEKGKTYLVYDKNESKAPKTLHTAYVQQITDNCYYLSWDYRPKIIIKFDFDSTYKVVEEYKG